MQFNHIRWGINAAVSAVFLLIALVGWFSIVPNPVAQATGVAVESARDVNRVPHTPVEYAFEGQSPRVELVPVKAAVGETITFGVDEEGMPTGQWSFLEKFFFFIIGFAVMGMLAGVTILLISLFTEEWEWAWERRRRAKATRAYIYG